MRLTQLIKPSMAKHSKQEASMVICCRIPMGKKSIMLPMLPASLRTMQNRPPNTTCPIFFRMKSITKTAPMDVSHYMTIHRAYTKATQIVVEYILVEGHCLHKYATGRIRHVNQVEIALHHTILAWLTMD